MPDRMSALDVSFLYLEERNTPMHTGSVMVFEVPDEGLDVERLTRHVEARIAFVPRYRQRLRGVPGRLANPVWVDDERFDISFHVRRSALPRPGSSRQLAELVARLHARPLDRDRPLWEMFIVEGLSGNRFAVVSKVHQALVDGRNTVDLAQVVLDEDAGRRSSPAPIWQPGPEPSAVELVAAALADSVRRPGEVVETVRTGLADVRSTAGKAAGMLGSLATAARAATRTAARPVPRSPLNAEIGEHRRYATVATDLQDYRRIRNHAVTRRRRRTSSPPALPQASTSVTVNDVVLATLTGALRAWLLGRGEPVPPSSVVRVLVPVSVRADEPQDVSAVGSRVASLLLDLPTGEASPLMRLHQISYQTMSHREGGQAVDAPAIAGMAGFAPPTLHALGARVASGLSARLFNLVVTNVPGPQQPLYLDGARMLSTYPVIPLARGQALSVGLTSYDGGVYYGLYGDREAMSDLDVLAQCLTDSLVELREAVR